MPKLKLKAIHCKSTEDTFGADEPFMLVNSHEVWRSNDMDDDDTADLSGIEPIEFTSEAKVELYEEDSPDPSDHLGTQYAYANQAGKGEKTMIFNQDDADYTLTYEVLA